MLKNQAEAARGPEFAVLSAMAHGEDDLAVAGPPVAARLEDGSFNGDLRVARTLRFLGAKDAEKSSPQRRKVAPADPEPRVVPPNNPMVLTVRAGSLHSPARRRSTSGSRSAGGRDAKARQPGAAPWGCPHLNPSR